MAQRKHAKDNSAVIELVEAAQNALKRNDLLALAKGITNKHELYKHLNKYPGLPFEINSGDLKNIRGLKLFQKTPPNKDEWTPLEKIFYAILWKDSKLTSINRIIEGLESVLDCPTNEIPKQAVVYHCFGMHLADRINQPLVDQHSVRAYRLIVNPPHAEIDSIRKSGLATAENAKDYRDWFKGIIEREQINEYSDTRLLDSYLFALGKFAKA